MVGDAERHAGTGGNGLRENEGVRRHAVGQGQRNEKGLSVNLDQTSVCAFLVETPRHSHEVKEGSKVGQAVAGLVVQHGHA